MHGEYDEFREYAASIQAPLGTLKKSCHTQYAKGHKI